MKSLKKITLFALALTVFSFVSMATENNDPNSKIVEKAKEAVANAEASDWETLAQSAEICLMKNENVEEAAGWLDKSLEIKETAYNLELKGDFLASKGKKSEARKYYVMAITKNKETDPVNPNTKLQQKIWDLR